MALSRITSNLSESTLKVTPIDENFDNNPAPNGTSDSTSVHLFKDIFELNRRRIMGYCLVLVPGDRSGAEEVFQEVSLVLWKRFADYDTNRSFAGWAYGIARLVSRRYHAKAMRDVQSLDERVLGVLFDPTFEENTVVNSIAQFRSEALANCVGSLTSRDRDLVTACYSGERTFKEVAATSNRSVHTIYKSLARIRRTLMECVARKMSLEGHK